MIHLFVYIAVVIGWYAAGFVAGTQWLDTGLLSVLAFLLGLPTGYLAYTLHRKTSGA